MAQRKNKRALIIAGATLAFLLIVIATVGVLKALQPKEADPFRSPDTSTTADAPSDDETTDTPTDDTTGYNTDAGKTDDEPSTIDPATVATIDITPMSLTVSYVKGIGAFEYEVLRTQSGTEYVEFRSPSLVGTKCTDDKGAFASILANPQSSESATLSTTTTVDDVKYGLSLASADCTSDSSLLSSYQDAFSDAFSLLKKMN